MHGFDDVAPPADASPATGPWYKELTRYHWFVLIVCWMAWFFDTLDQQLFGLRECTLAALAALQGFVEFAGAHQPGHAVLVDEAAPGRHVEAVRGRDRLHGVDAPRAEAMRNALPEIARHSSDRERVAASLRDAMVRISRSRRDRSTWKRPIAFRCKANRQHRLRGRDVEPLVGSHG